MQATTEKLQSKQVSSVDLINEFYKKHEQWIDHHIFTTVAPKQTLIQLAKDADEEIQKNSFDRKPLLGIPFAVKANINTKQFVTCAGTPGLSDCTPSTNSPVLQKLLDAGGILVGKTNMHEFAMGILSTNRLYGNVKNPYDKSTIPGGSSGGSAVAVSTRTVPFSLGSDTAGSMRVPAALCGCIGFRPTTHLYSQENVVPLCSTMDTIGVFANNVEDVIKVHKIIVESKEIKINSIVGVRIGVPRTYFYENVDRESLQLVEKALQALKEKGAILVENDSIEEIDTFAKAEYTTVAYESLREISMYMLHQNYAKSLKDVCNQILDNKVKDAFLVHHANISYADYHDAITVQRPKLKRVYKEYFHRNNVTVLAIPTTLLPARNVGEDGMVDVNGKPWLAGKAYLHNTYPSSLAGLPSISVPCGFVGNLPFGIEFVAMEGEDDTLLQVAKLYEHIRGDFPEPKFE